MTPRRLDVLVIGGSSGSIEALAAILPALPADFPIPIALVIHVAPHRPSLIARVLDETCALEVREAEDKAALRPGTVCVAPPDYHLLVERDRRAALSVDAPVQFSRPSIDVLFESAADAFGPGAAGLLLTGANDDGAAGLARIHRAGGLTIVQAPATAAAPEMPAAALRRFAPDHVVPLPDLGRFVAGLALPPYPEASP